MSSYEEWLEWRRRYFLGNESLDYDDYKSMALSDWENEGGSNLGSLPDEGCEGGHY